MADGPIDSAELAPEKSPVLDALEQFAQFADEVYDVPQSRPMYWEGNPNRVAMRSVGRVLCKWRHAVKPHRPPSALIVRLARRLPSVVTDIATHPKRILQRRRSMEPISRLRELDPSCIRWLTRQPGNTIAEKSGHRRTVLAVHRYESVDTLENRVVRDLLKRCSVLASDYLRKYQPDYPNHEWIRMTEKFRNLCRRLEALPQLHEVSGFPSLPKPNYVLLHESRYKQVWRSYMEVIRQQLRRQQLWTWRKEAFADMVTIAWMSSASRGLTNHNSRKAAHRFDLRIRETPLRGTFFDWSGLPPVWNQNPKSAFYIGPLASAGGLARSFGFDPAEKHLPDDLGSSSSGTFIAKWKDRAWSSAKLVLNFQEKGSYESTSQEMPIGSDAAILELIDIETRKATQRSVIPLALTSQPKRLDALHADWFLT